jgi:hypothetical protein
MSWGLKMGTDRPAPREQPGDFDAAELRAAAEFFQNEVLGAIDDLSDMPMPLVRGGSKDFPAPLPEQRAAAQGLSVLRQSAEDAIAVLFAATFALQAGRDVVPGIRVLVRPYLQAYRDRR